MSFKQCKPILVRVYMIYFCTNLVDCARVGLAALLSLQTNPVFHSSQTVASISTWVHTLRRTLKSLARATAHECEYHTVKRDAQEKSSIKFYITYAVR